VVALIDVVGLNVVVDVVWITFVVVVLVGVVHAVVIRIINPISIDIFFIKIPLLG